MTNYCKNAQMRHGRYDVKYVQYKYDILETTKCFQLVQYKEMSL
jgi:hypothetical protein